MFVNLTPHDVTICGVTIPKDGRLVRVAMRRVYSHHILDVPIFEEYPGEVMGLPEPEPGIVYIVSRMVLEAADRTDLVSPGTLQRDPAGNIIGCSDLVCIP